MKELVKGLVKYSLFGVFVIFLDRLHQKYGRSRSISSSSDTAVRLDSLSLSVYLSLLCLSVCFEHFSLTL